MSDYITKLNPYDGKLQLVFNNNLIHFKDSVASYANLPITGNIEGDARVTLDTDNFYIWTIASGSGALSDWKLIGATTTLDWSAISNKPSSSVANIDSAVSLKHVQGTDQGLDTGGANAVVVADVKDAVTKKHTQNTDTVLTTNGSTALINTGTLKSNLSADAGITVDGHDISVELPLKLDELAALPEILTLYNFNEGAGQLPVVDAAGRNSVTPTYNNFTLATSEKKFGVGSLNTDFSSGSVLFTGSNMGDFDIFDDLIDTYTLDFWYKPSVAQLAASAGTVQYALNYSDDSTPGWGPVIINGWGLIVTKSKLGLLLRRNSINEALEFYPGPQLTNDWFHFVIYKSGNKVSLYRNGVQYSYDTLNAPVIVGAAKYLASSFFLNGGASKGNIDSIRLSKGNLLGLNPNVGLTDTYSMPVAEPTFAASAATVAIISADGTALIRGTNTDTQLASTVTNSHVQGTDQGLDTGGINAVTAAQAKAGYTHSGVTTGNPHSVTKTDVGLSNVDNKSEATIITDVKSDSDVADAISKKHTRKHNIDGTDDHYGVSGATENNFASFTAGGLIKDSTKKAADFEPALSKGNLTAGSTKIAIGGTGTGAVIGVGASVDVVPSGIDHDDLKGVDVATTGQTYGHITDGAQTIYGAKTFNSQIVGSTSGNAIATRGTFVNGDLSTGKLTVTHSKGLSAPYSVIVAVFNNSNLQIIPDNVTGAENTFEIDLTSYGVLTGTWGYIYIA